MDKIDKLKILEKTLLIHSLSLMFLTDLTKISAPLILYPENQPTKLNLLLTKL
jgi:hypothetical protein